MSVNNNTVHHSKTRNELVLLWVHSDSSICSFFLVAVVDFIPFLHYFFFLSRALSLWKWKKTMEDCIGSNALKYHRYRIKLFSINNERNLCVNLN